MGTGFFQHGHTYMAHPVACAAGLAVQEALADEQLLGRVRLQGARLRELLRARLDDHPHVGDIRGRGLFFGIELVADRASKRPFAPELKVNAKIKAAAMERGLICYAMGGTIDGRYGDHLMLAPPFIVTDARARADRPAPSAPRSTPALARSQPPPERASRAAGRGHARRPWLKPLRWSRRG